jgi:sortase B
MTANIGIKTIRFASGLVNTAVLAIVLLLLAVGSYALWDSNQIYRAADASRYEAYKPSEENEGKSFAELRGINPEVTAWLTVYGTHIDYPVTRGEDNMKYVNTDAEGNYSLSGAVFLDSGNRADFSDFNSILYGHHMEKNAMFGEIGRFAEKGYFEARRYGNLYCGGKDYGLEFFAFVRADAYDGAVFRAGVEGEEAREDYLRALLAAASFSRDIPVSAKDRIVLLSTCSPGSTNGRDILIGKITDKVYEDMFQTGEDGAPGAPGTDGAGVPWEPLWLTIAVAAAVLLATFVLIRNGRRASGNEDGRGRANGKAAPYK